MNNDDIRHAALKTKSVSFSELMKVKIRKEGVILRDAHMEICRVGIEVAECQDGLPTDKLEAQIDAISRLPIEKIGDVYAHVNGIQFFISHLPTQIALFANEAKIDNLASRYFRAVKTFYESTRRLKGLMDKDIDRQLKRVASGS